MYRNFKVDTNNIGAYCRAEGQSPEDDPEAAHRPASGGIRHSEQCAPPLPFKIMSILLSCQILFLR